MKLYQVPVMVTVSIEDEDYDSIPPPPDSDWAAEVLRSNLQDQMERDGVHDGSYTYEVVGIDGIPAYEDDPDSPPVPAMPIEQEVREPASDDHEPEVPTDYDPNGGEA